MSDDVQGGPQKKGRDIFKIGPSPDGMGATRPSRAATEILKDLAQVDKAIESAMPSKSIQDAIKSMNGGPAMEEARRVTLHLDALKEAFGPTEKLQESLRALTGQFGPESGIGKIVRQIENQGRSIDALRLDAPASEIEPLITDFDLPPNPIHETNDRLGRIEQRFEQMLDVAANSAEIATGLQAHAAQFLVKFENAASDNDRSASRAIRLGVIAVVIAIAMPVVQTAYTELWRVPQDSASMEAVVADTQTEIATLRQVQIEAAERIAAALERSDKQMVDALEEVARSLKVASNAPAIAPNAEEKVK
ncbi:hypothetical protein LAZ40_02710 [Cereibacter sphaeroides]|uniref:hypothetical protein n=1 Tax=Cereibacter sphaeroides TaxID=1063 RepID=UPI001F416C25|nr:hypothetical protein [Cereibacter sphaeroides]MCE6957968.1 hypothetical protein [Cereibacter sphaeroides]MCE6971775.1 hypothetical protein [Cereibacter sphaeroides]